jgi:hypothetical protein
MPLAFEERRGKSGEKHNPDAFQISPAYRVIFRNNASGLSTVENVSASAQPSTFYHGYPYHHSHAAIIMFIVYKSVDDLAWGIY